MRLLKEIQHKSSSRALVKKPLDDVDLIPIAKRLSTGTPSVPSFASMEQETL